MLRLSPALHSCICPALSMLHCKMFPPYTGCNGSHCFLGYLGHSACLWHHRQSVWFLKLQLTCGELCMQDVARLQPALSALPPHPSPHRPLMHHQHLGSHYSQGGAPFQPHQPQSQPPSQGHQVAATPVSWPTQPQPHFSQVMPTRLTSQLQKLARAETQIVKHE